MNVRSKVLKIRNLPHDGKKVAQITSKPYLFIIICLLIGGALLFTRMYLLGVVIAILFLCYLLFVRDVVLVEFFDRYVVFYLNNGQDECYLLFWEDVASWQLVQHRNDLDELKVVLKNQQTISLRCLGRKKLLRWFHTYVDTQAQTRETFPKQHV